MPSISVIICTRNRADSLRSTLESIGRVSVPEGWTVELLVVDNGSMDHTRAVVNEARMSNVNLRYVSEPLPGLSNGRNAGLREASGEIILFTDDDIRVPHNWVEGMCRPILEGKADAVAGGVVFPPHVEQVLKTCLLEKRQGWVASTHWLDPQHPSQMVGANMAFHRRVLKRVPNFDVELGAGALGFSEESLFSSQLLAAGFVIVSALDVVVEHHLDCAKLTSERLLDMARKMGRSHAFVFHHWRHRRSRLVVPRLILCHLRRHWVRQFGRIGRHSANGISDKLLALEAELAFYREYIVQRRREPKYPKRPSTL